MKYQKNLMSHMYFNPHTWQEWSNAFDEEKAEMRRNLKDTFGYV